MDKIPLINLADYPQLQLICWNYHLPTIEPEYALGLYENHWLLVDEKTLTAKELELINSLHVDKTMYLEFYPYKTGTGKRYKEKKLFHFITQSN